MDGRWKLFSFLCMDEVLLQKANYWEGQQQGEENLELGRHIELVNLIRKMKTNWLFCFLVCYGTQSEIASVKLTQQTKSRDLWSYTVLLDEVTPSESRARGAEVAGAGVDNERKRGQSGGRDSGTNTALQENKQVVSQE